VTAPERGADLLDEVRDFLARFVAFPSQGALHAAALWVVVTHLAQHFHITPRLALLSPEPGSGKTRALEVLALLVARSFFSFSASAAAIFRTLALESRTLLFDEVDAVFTKKGKDDGNEDLRALLNVGYRRGATIPRCVGPKHDVVMFDVFAPAALAGLGDLPDTLMTRSVIIRMRPRGRGEHIEQFRIRMHEAEGHALRDRLEAWAESVGPEVGEAWPELPPGVVDRAAELWEPLIAAADAAGGHWPDTARSACVELLKVASDREVSLGVRLLADLREVFGDRDAMSTADILKRLNELDEAPWGDLYGKPMQPRTLARMLKRYSVTSTDVKVDNQTRKGYRREELWDAWTRYLAPVPAEGQLGQPGDDGTADRVTDEAPEVAPGADPMGNRGQPPQPTSVAQVALVAEASPNGQPSTSVPDATPAKVAQVAPVRGTKRPLGDRAADRVAELRPVDLDTLRARYAEALSRAGGAPAWWTDTARAEPLAVVAALELIAEDRQAGQLAGNAPAYLAAARAAVNGVSA
jgi:hypothetical protein